MKKLIGLCLIVGLVFFLSSVGADAGSRERHVITKSGEHHHFHATGRSATCSGRAVVRGSCSGSTRAFAAPRIQSCGSSRGKARVQRTVRIRSSRGCPAGGCP